MKSFTTNSSDFMFNRSLRNCSRLWLTILNFEYPITNDLERLLNMLNEQQADVSKFTHLTIFTPYSARLKHDIVNTIELSFDKNHAIQSIEELLQIVERKLEED